MLSVTWFIPVSHTDFNAMPASIWIRCLQIIPYLRDLGVTCRINDTESHADVCVFVRWQDDRAIRRAEEMKRRHVPVLFDLCVNYFDETPVFEGGAGATADRVRETRRFLDLADAVTCSSEFIASRAAENHPRVYTLPDSVDLRHFSSSKNLGDFDRSPLRAVWSGISIKARPLISLLCPLAKRGIPLTVISDRRPALDGEFRFVPWTYETFPRQILDGEICLAPRQTDNPYDLGHSHFKIGVFLAQGVPALASPVPSYLRLLDDGSCGRICRTDRDWEDALDRAIAHRDELSSRSRSARDRMKSFSTESLARDYLKVFSEIAGVTAAAAARPS